MDFEEFMWANGYMEEHIEQIFMNMKDLKPLPTAIFEKLDSLFVDYIYCGGMPEAVNTFVQEKVFTNVFAVHSRIYRDYQDDITNYVSGLDAAKVLNVYRHITAQLAKDNHKFQISKLGHGARFREYLGTEEWLKDAGVVNIAYNLDILDFPFNENEDSTNFRMYYGDTSLLIATLDEYAKEDLSVNKNFGIYKGALYESLVSEALKKSGYELFFYKNENSTIELDFVIRVKNDIIPIEVRSIKGKAKSLNLIMKEIDNINYAIKLSHNNIGFNDNVFTFPYFLTFLLKRFFKDTNYIRW